MKISWIGTAWAYLKGALSFGTTGRLAVVDYIIEEVLCALMNLESVAANLAKAHALLANVCDKLDYYAEYIPVPWMGYYDAIRTAFGDMRDTLADGKVERAEIERVIANVKAAVAMWHK